MSNRVDRYCLTCGNVTVADAGYYAGSSFYQCETCGRRGQQEFFPKATVFHKITASPEVLAEKLVYLILDCDGFVWWESTLCGRILWKIKAEAIAATLEKLKEVDNAAEM